MNIRTQIRIVVLGAALCLPGACMPAVHVLAAAPALNDGGGNSDTRPVGASCAPTGDYWICTTPEGGMWRCDNAYDPTACVNINPSPQSQAGSRPVIVHPVIGGVLDPSWNSVTSTSPHLPVRAGSVAP